MRNREYDSVENLTLEEDGHYHLRVPAFYEYDSHANYIVDFVFDTGAFLTVLTRSTATMLGFIDRFTVRPDIPLTGFSGGCRADLKEIPGLIIGGKRLTGVKVAVPHIDTDMDILGLNVLEYFKYFIDTEKDEICFSANPKPEISEYLQVKSILAISASEK